MAPGRRRRGQGKAPAAAAFRHGWKPGDLVLAKVKGFPAWPATVSEPDKWGYSSDGRKVLVYFFGTKQIAFCNPVDVEAFTEEKKTSLRTKRHGKGSDFLRALDEIILISEKSKKLSLEGAQSGDEGTISDAAPLDASCANGLDDRTGGNDYLPSVSEGPQIPPVDLSSVPSGAFEQITEANELGNFDAAPGHPTPSVVEANECKRASLLIKFVSKKRSRMCSLKTSGISEDVLSSCPTRCRQTMGQGKEIRSLSSSQENIVEVLDVKSCSLLVLGRNTNNCDRPHASSSSSLKSSSTTFESGESSSNSRSPSPMEEMESTSIGESAAVADAVVEDKKSEATEAIASSTEDTDVGKVPSLFITVGTSARVASGVGAEATLMKRKRKPNRKRSMPINNIEVVKNLNGDVCENITSKLSSASEKTDQSSRGDDHLPLVKRARARMSDLSSQQMDSNISVETISTVHASDNSTARLVSSDECSSGVLLGVREEDKANYLFSSDGSKSKVNVRSSWSSKHSYLAGCLDNEASLPPSKRLHRALEAMSELIADAAAVSTEPEKNETEILHGRPYMHESHPQQLSIDHDCQKASTMNQNMLQDAALLSDDTFCSSANVLASQFSVKACKDRDERGCRDTNKFENSPNCCVSSPDLQKLSNINTRGNDMLQEVHDTFPTIRKSDEILTSNENELMLVTEDSESTSAVDIGKKKPNIPFQMDNSSRVATDIPTNKSIGESKSKTLGNQIPKIVSPQKGDDESLHASTEENDAGSSQTGHASFSLKSQSRDIKGSKVYMERNCFSASGVGGELHAKNYVLKSIEKCSNICGVNGSLKSFEALLGSLSRTKESIGRATRVAIDCARNGTASEVMDLLLRNLEKEPNLYRRVDLFFLLDSITRCSQCHKGDVGESYSLAVQALLPRLLSAAAPPGYASRENRKQCLKVLRLWLERKTLPESVLRCHVQDLDSVSDNMPYLKRPSRAERALNDPLRDMDEISLDEYGSNTSLQLPRFMMPNLCDDNEESRSLNVISTCDVAPSHSGEKLTESNIMPELTERRCHILRDVDVELEMEDVSPREMNGFSEVCTNEMTASVTQSPSLVHPPLPDDVAPLPPPLPLSPPPQLPTLPPPHSYLLPTPFMQNTSLAVASCNDANPQDSLTHGVSLEFNQFPLGSTLPTNCYQNQKTQQDSVNFFASSTFNACSGIQPVIDAAGLENLQNSAIAPFPIKKIHIPPPVASISEQFSFLQSKPPHRWQQFNGESESSVLSRCSNHLRAGEDPNCNTWSNLRHGHDQFDSKSSAVHDAYAVSPLSERTDPLSRYGHNEQCLNQNLGMSFPVVGLGYQQGGSTYYPTGAAPLSSIYSRPGAADLKSYSGSCSEVDFCTQLGS